MKIAIDLRSLQSGAITGVENYVLNLTSHLLKLDHQNEYVLFYNSWRRQPLPADFHFVNAKLVKTGWPNRLLNLAFKAGLSKLEDLIGDFDVLFMPNLNQISLGGKSKLAITVHDLSPVVTPEFYDLKRNLWHRFVNFKKIFKRADLVFSVSEHTKADLQSLFGVPEEKIVVAYPGIDAAALQNGAPVSAQRAVRAKYGLPGRFVLFLNTLEPRKNLQGLLKAFEMVSEPVSLVIAGKRGWKYRSMLQEISRSRKKNKIHLLGYVPEEDKAALLALSEALVYPSLYEGFGFQPLEAAAAGIPVVASQVTSIPEVMGSTALLINPYNSHDMASAIDAVVSDESLRQGLIQKGKVRARQFEWEKTARSVLDGFKKLSASI